MKESLDIGRTLQALAPELITSYEDKNFLGCSLGKLQDRYYRYYLTDQRVDKWSKIYGLVMATSTVVCLILGLIWSRDYFVIMIVLGTISTIAVCLYILSEYRNKKKFEKIFLPQVKEFCEATENLIDSRYWWKKVIDKSVVKEELIRMAHKVSTKQMEFDKISPRNHTYVVEIVECGEQLMKAETKLQTGIRAAEKFGLVFERRELFPS